MIFEPKDRERFAEAFVRLIASVPDPKWQARLLGRCETAIGWLNAGRQLPNCAEANMAVIVLRVVMQHIYQGFPLALPVAVLEAYEAAGDNLETPLSECEDCGYAVPRSFRHCPLCNGWTGLGAYATKRARRALIN